MMIDGIPNRPLYFYQKDMIGCHRLQLACEKGHADVIEILYGPETGAKWDDENEKLRSSRYVGCLTTLW